MAGTAILLASRSPQRRAILEQLGLSFRVVPSAHEEETVAGDPVATVERNARGKAVEVAARASLRPGEAVIGVDTVVVLDGEVLGKAAGEAQARDYLTRLAGRTHEVVSGLCLLLDGRESVAHAVSAVTFRPLRTEVIERYLVSGEWRDRAGAYAIQGIGSVLVQGVRGDYFNVVGLPVPLLADRLEASGVGALSWLPADAAPRAGSAGPAA